MLNERGFGLILFIIIIFLISVGIISGSLYFRFNFQHKEVKNGISNNQTNPTTNNINQESPISGNNKILFVSKKNILTTALPNGKDIKPFLISGNQDINSTSEIQGNGIISPDLNKVLFKTYVKYDPATPNNPDYKIGLSNANYLSSTDGKLLTKIDLTKLNNFGDSGIVTFLGWSSDGKYLVYKNETTLDDIYSRRQVIGKYDVTTNQSTGIFSKTAPAIYVLFYDPNKSLLAFYEDNQFASKANTGHIIDLATNSDTLFDPPNLDYSRGSLLTPNPYFITSDTDFNSIERTKLYLYSYYEPKKFLASFSLNTQSEVYSNYLIWSPKFNYFAIPVREKASQNNPNGFLNIYNRDGTLKLNKAIIFPDMYPGGNAFSNDEKYFLMVGISRKEDNVPGDTPVWQAINIDTGEIIIPRFTSQDLGLNTTYWFN